MSNRRLLTRAYERGCAAYENGFGYGSNPYLSDTPEATKWDEGFQDAKAHYDKENEDEYEDLEK